MVNSVSKSMLFEIKHKLNKHICFSIITEVLNLEIDWYSGDLANLDHLIDILRTSDLWYNPRNTDLWFKKSNDDVILTRSVHNQDLWCDYNFQIKIPWDLFLAQYNSLKKS